MFWNTLLGQKAWAIVVIWVEITVNYSVLEQVIWQEGLGSAATLPENTIIYSVLELVVWQEGLNHCFNMGRKHCNLQCFGAMFFDVVGL